MLVETTNRDRITLLALAVVTATACSGAQNQPLSAAGDEITPQAAAPPILDLDNETSRRRAFVLVRGSTNPDETIVFHFAGAIYADVPAPPDAEPRREFRRPLLHFEGFNIARFIPTTDGATRMLSREVTFYIDENGSLIDCWYNPLSENSVPVVHVWNDPVNFTLGDVSAQQLGDVIAFRVEVSLSYTSPLPIDEFPIHSAGNTYESTEIFDFFSPINDLRNPAVTSAQATLSWTRIGQWLPWMQMGQRPGRLIYHAQGHKVTGGFESLPQHLREWVLDRAPAFAEAPHIDEDDRPNATSWSRFRQLFDAGEVQSSCATD